MIGGRYSRDRVVGRGGMGAVWFGRDELLGRPVAVKRLGGQVGVDNTDAERAEREARIAARIVHPNVVAVFDLVDAEDGLWLVMEYVAGSTLSERIKAAGRLTPDESAAVLAQAAEALTAAHEAGVVHRDVKPSNILVTEDGVAKLSDFGIARAEQDPSLTATGLVTGSPAYISPEVASGRPATPASDVWSLGATAFHALTGHPPYDVGDNVLGALYRIVHEQPPELADGGWLAPLVRGTMVQDPAARWSMVQVTEFLHAGPDRSAQVSVPVSVSAPGPTPSSSTLEEPPTALAPVLAGAGPVIDEATTQVAPTPAAAPAPPPVIPPGRPGSEGGRRAARPGRALPVVVGVVLLAVTVLVALLLLTGGDDEQQTPSAGGSTSATGEPSPSQGSPSPSEPAAPTADEMESYVADYVSLAASDPSAAFDQLTPAYQRASNGFPGYEGFWGGVTDVNVRSATADPDTLTITYEYSYRFEGRQRRDTVRMTLEQTDDGALLIAGADTL
ncbi:serine/threonine-protein kinase [Nocardioides nanhaiensis]|uniref:serine/threonine-protein kinase n=1 Tax=Nocardioides nanhaiensis TaxID=1476871 RepID=UPI0031E9A9C5